MIDAQFGHDLNISWGGNISDVQGALGLRQADGGACIKLDLAVISDIYKERFFDFDNNIVAHDLQFTGVCRHGKKRFLAW